MNKTIIKALLNDNKHFSQALHACIGLDYKKPYSIFEISGKFTINQLLKIAGPDHTPLKEIFVILTRTDSGCYNRYHVATLDRSGSLNIDIKHWGYNNHESYSIDYFHTKKDFENVRKTAAHTIVICQNRDFLSIPERTTIDYSQRFKLISTTKACTYYGGDTYISRLELKENNAYFSIDTSRLCKTLNPDLLIDKSGYLVGYNRESLRRRAAAMRTEKIYNEYKSIDNTARLKALKSDILAAKNNIVTMLINATTAAALETINKKLGYFNGIEGLLKRLERLEKVEKNKEYKSIDNFFNEYNSIYERLKAI